MNSIPTDLQTMLPGTGYTPYNIVILAFAYPAYLCGDACIGPGVALQFDSRVTALNSASKYPGQFAFATNTFGFNGGGTNPYKGDSPGCQAFFAQLRAWQALEPKKRRVHISVGGAFGVDTMVVDWDGREVAAAKGLTLLAQLFPAATGVPVAGIDLDVEIMDAVPMCRVMSTLAKVTVELRRQLDAAGLPTVLVSHAPQTPYLDTTYAVQDATCTAPSNALAFFGCYYRMLALIQREMPRALAPGLFQLNIQAYNNPPWQGAQYDLTLLPVVSAGGVPVPGVGKSPPLCPTQLLLGMYTNTTQPDSILSPADMHLVSAGGFGTMIWSDVGSDLVGRGIMLGYFPPPAALKTATLATVAERDPTRTCVQQEPHLVPNLVIVATVFAVATVAAIIVAAVLGSRARRPATSEDGTLSTI